MKILFFTATLLFSAALFSQCKHPKYSADSLPGEALRFGSGGGFTGVETTYVLLENGQLFQATSRPAKTEELSACKRKEAKKMFETAESIGLLDVKFMHPGNMYSFLEFEDDGRQCRVTWGDGEHTVDPKIKDLYDQLMKLAQAKK